VPGAEGPRGNGQRPSQARSWIFEGQPPNGLTGDPRAPVSCISTRVGQAREGPGGRTAVVLVYVEDADAAGRQSGWSAPVDAFFESGGECSRSCTPQLPVPSRVNDAGALRRAAAGKACFSGRRQAQACRGPKARGERATAVASSIMDLRRPAPEWSYGRSGSARKLHLDAGGPYPRKTRGPAPSRTCVRRGAGP